MGHSEDSSSPGGAGECPGLPLVNIFALGRAFAKLGLAPTHRSYQRDALACFQVSPFSRRRDVKTCQKAKQ